MDSSETTGGTGEKGAAASLFHPLAMNSSRHWARLLRTGGGVDRNARFRALLITLSSPLWSPLRSAERALYGPRLKRTVVHPEPVFILGHWRTGTTLLHYLMHRDPGFGSVSLFQTLVPDAFLTARGPLGPVMRRIVPRKRPMDNMELGLDLPQEEEYATCNLSGHSLYVGWYFPRRMRELFQRCVLFEDASPAVVDEWKRVYLDVLKKATLHGGGKPLLLKNPANTARIPQLLEMFPSARFVHIHRDPHAVFRSTVKLHRSVYDLVGLQRVDDDEIEETVLYLYRGLMQRYLDTRGLIPEGRLVEVAYADLERRPVEEMRRVYESLRLSGWEGVRPSVEAYVEARQGYEKNRHVFTARDIARVRREWQFAFDHWGYTHPDD